MAVYNESLINNASNLLELATGVGSAMGQEFLIGNLILIGFFMCFLLIAVKADVKEVLIIDSFLTTVLSILLYSAGMISAAVIAFPAVLFFIMMVVYFMTG
ncbi:MAG: hypothetical protein QW165_04560 [Candidatus Woesearchaeota archaeon]